MTTTDIQTFVQYCQKKLYYGQKSVQCVNWTKCFVHMKLCWNEQKSSDGNQIESAKVVGQ